MSRSIREHRQGELSIELCLLLRYLFDVKVLGRRLKIILYIVKT
jgi:hypothetical protein